MKKIISLLIICLIVLTGCSQFEKGECIYDGTQIYETNRFIDYSCECMSEQEEDYKFEMINLPYEPKIKFEDKKHMAMIDDHWFCKCYRHYIVTEEITDYYWWSGRFDGDCLKFNEEGNCIQHSCENFYGTRVYNKTDIEEFVWSY